MATTLQAYYDGRQSIDDDGSLAFEMPADFSSVELRTSYRQGQRDMRSELRLSADREWDDV